MGTNNQQGAEHEVGTRHSAEEPPSNAAAGQGGLTRPAGYDSDASEIVPGSDLDDGTAGTPSGRERYAQPMLGPDDEMGRAPSGQGEH